MRGISLVTPDKCTARFMLHCDPEVGWVGWRSIRSCCQFSYGCIYGHATVQCAAVSQRDTLKVQSHKLFWSLSTCKTHQHTNKVQGPKKHGGVLEPLFKINIGENFSILRTYQMRLFACNNYLHATNETYGSAIEWKSKDFANRESPCKVVFWT